MAVAVNEILFRLLGDEDDAERSLRQVALELQAFSRLHAEAEAEVDTEQAEARLKALQEELAILDKSTTDVKVTADIATLQAQIAAVRAELAGLDREEVEIGIDLDRSKVDLMRELATRTMMVGRAAASAAGDTRSFLQRIAASTVNIGPFTTQLRTMAPLLGVVLALLAAAASAVTALVVSFGAAVAGAGALAIALGGVLVPAIGLAILGFQRFEDQAKKAGTPAHALAQAFEDLKGAAEGLQRAADPVLQALADGIRQIIPAVRQLVPAFQSFGQQAGRAVSTVFDTLADPRVVSGFEQLLRVGGRALRPLARIAGALGRVLLNIANAAMPFLIDGLRSVADAAEGFANVTDNAEGLSSVVGELVGHLRAWLRLAGAIGEIFVGLFEAIGPQARQFVEFLADGAQNIADWTRSAEGTDALQRFFADTLPLAQELIGLIGKLAIVVLQVGQFLAPAVTPMVSAFSDILNVVIFVLDLLNKIPAPIRAIVGTVALLFSPLGLVRGATITLRIAFGLLVGVIGQFGRVTSAVMAGAKAAIAAVFNWVKTAGRNAWNTMVNAVRAAWNRAKTIVSTVGNAIKTAAQTAWNAVTGVVRGALNTVKNVVQTVWNAVKTAVRTAVSAVRNAVSNGFNALKGIVSGALGAVRGAVSTAWNTIKTAITSAVDSIKTAIENGFNAVKGIVQSGLQAALGVVEGIADAFFNAGRAIIESLIDGITSMAEAAVDAVEGVIDRALSVLPGSEPKDPRSPARHLDRRGEAFVRNFADGILAARADLARAVAAVMPQVGIAAGGLSASVAAGGGLGRGAGGPLTQNFNISSPGAQVPDARATAAKLALLYRQRGGAF
jgi:phage-related protein